MNGEAYVEHAWCPCVTKLSRFELDGTAVFDAVLIHHYVEVEHIDLGRITIHPRSFAWRLCE